MGQHLEEGTGPLDPILWFGYVEVLCLRVCLREGVHTRLRPEQVFGCRVGKSGACRDELVRRNVLLRFQPAFNITHLVAWASVTSPFPVLLSRACREYRQLQA